MIAVDSYLLGAVVLFGEMLFLDRVEVSRR
jgi:hypothetical protein